MALVCMISTGIRWLRQPAVRPKLGYVYLQLAALKRHLFVPLYLVPRKIAIDVIRGDHSK